VNALEDRLELERKELLARLTRGLQEQIPMTKFLRIHFVEFEPHCLILAAPLEPSLNHRGTAFGPGVFTAAALAPWLLLVRKAWSERIVTRILLRRCEFSLLRPITCDYRARCDSLPALDLQTLRRAGKVRASATSHILMDDGPPAATYTAHYTLLAEPDTTLIEGDLTLPFPEAWRT